MLNIVLFGPPGAGKGTQAQYLIENFKLIHLSTGDLLRDQIARGTELGVKAKDLISKGELVPDNVVIGMIQSKLEENSDSRGFIFDGFPRTTEQAGALDKLLAGIGTQISAMFALDVETQELINRLLERGKTSGRPDDQDVSVIENRITVYNRKTSPLIDYYSARGKFHAIRGMGTIEEIAARLKDAIEKLD